MNEVLQYDVFMFMYGTETNKANDNKRRYG